MIDLEVFAREHVRQVEDAKFQSEMALLQKELDCLEPGKYLCCNLELSHTSPHLLDSRKPFTTVSHICAYDFNPRNDTKQEKVAQECAAWSVWDCIWKYNSDAKSTRLVGPSGRK